MARSVTALILAFLVLALPAGSLRADEVYLKNGDRLSGQIVSLGEQKLVLETEFVGKLAIDWAHVDRISTEAPLTVVLENGAILKGVVKPSDVPGRMELARESAAKPEPVELAQVKAINPPKETVVKLNGRINVGFNKASGNTDTENLHADTEIVARTVNHRLTLGGDYNRSSEDNHKTVDNSAGRLKHDYFFTRQIYWYLNGLLERDEFKDIRLRATAGPGLGYQIFEGELMNLAVETGPSYVYTNYNHGGSDDSLSGRWAVRFDRFFFEKLFQYYFSNEGYISSSDTKDVFMFTRTGLRFPVHGGLFLNAGWEWDWDNTPADDADKSDYRYILSIGYGF
jgi:putative salt-induced outer membrane protein YdiY/sRNA-binding regulator protein Hfq